MKPYPAYRYLWPPRPEKKIPSSGLGFYERAGWWAQTKKNGTCTVIFARGDQVIFKTRHNDDHKLWDPLEDHIRFFSGSKNWYVFVAELLHSKVSNGPRNELFIFDVLVSDGQELIGETFESRMNLLERIFPGVDEGDQFRVSPYVTRAKCFHSDFAGLYKNLGDENEGLVLKNPKAKLLSPFKPNSNAGWMVKCRLPHKNYSF